MIILFSKTNKKHLKLMALLSQGVLGFNNIQLVHLLPVKNETLGLFAKDKTKD